MPRIAFFQHCFCADFTANFDYSFIAFLAMCFLVMAEVRYCSCFSAFRAYVVRLFGNVAFQMNCKLCFITADKVTMFADNFAMEVFFVALDALLILVFFGTALPRAWISFFVSF